MTTHAAVLHVSQAKNMASKKLNAPHPRENPVPCRYKSVALILWFH
jgi:hypothetical protein